jgi:hypothetical protein
MLLAFVLKVNEGDEPKAETGCCSNVIMHAHSAWFVVQSDPRLHFILSQHGIWRLSNRDVDPF